MACPSICDVATLARELRHPIWHACAHKFSGIRSFQLAIDNSTQNAFDKAITIQQAVKKGRCCARGTNMKDNGTKSKLLKAAISVFGNQGYSGGSVRQIADLANTNIGAIKYHYSSKEQLWRSVVDYLFNKLGESIMRDSEMWPSMTPRDRVVNSTRNYIYFCAEYPELNRIILSETIQNGGRLHWLAENHVRLFIERSTAWMAIAQENGVYPKEISVLNLVFIATSAAQNLFLMAPFIEQAFGIDVFKSDQIEKHVEAVVKLLLNEAEMDGSAIGLS
jgi:AcrR family transcriptional regulator